MTQGASTSKTRAATTKNEILSIINNSINKIDITNILKTVNYNTNRIDTLHNFQKYRKEGGIFTHIAELIGFNDSEKLIKFEHLVGLILSGVPKSVYNNKSGQIKKFNDFTKFEEKIKMKLMTQNKLNGAYDFSLNQLGRKLKDIYGDDYHISIDASNSNVENKTQSTLRNRSNLSKTFNNNSLKKIMKSSIKDNIVHTAASILDPGSSASNEKFYMYLKQSNSNGEYIIHDNISRSSLSNYEYRVKFKNSSTKKNIIHENPKIIKTNITDIEYFKLTITTPSFSNEIPSCIKNNKAVTVNVYYYFDKNKGKKNNLIQIKQPSQNPKEIYIEKQSEANIKNKITKINKATINIHSYEKSGLSIQDIVNVSQHIFSLANQTKYINPSEKALLESLLTIKRIGDGFQHEYAKLLTKTLDKPFFVLSFDRLSSYLGIKKYKSHVISQVQNKFYLWIPKDNIISKNKVIHNVGFKKKSSFNNMLRNNKKGKQKELIYALMNNNKKKPNRLSNHNKNLYNILKQAIKVHKLKSTNTKNNSFHTPQNNSNTSRSSNTAQSRNTPQSRNRGVQSRPKSPKNNIENNTGRSRSRERT